jgi:hypothetical protein
MLVFAINGLGAPEYPEDDKALSTYLRQALAFVDKYSPNFIFLCGGCTNRPNLSEAEAMLRWFGCHAPHLLERIVLLEDSLTARQNVEELNRHVGGGTSVVYFTEYSRRFEARILCACYLMVGWRVVGLVHDKRSMRPDRRLLRYTVYAPLALSVEMFPGLAGAQEQFRVLHILRTRAAAT